MAIASTDMQIDFSLMAALIKVFRVQSHTPDPSATLFYDEGGKPQQKLDPYMWPFSHKIFWTPGQKVSKPTN